MSTINWVGIKLNKLDIYSPFVVMCIKFLDPIQVGYIIDKVFK